jgi:hypothetical protein
VQIADGQTSNYFLTTFGRASRETVCSCEVKMSPNLSQALHLLNGDTVQSEDSAGRLIEQLLAEGKTGEQIVEELYIRCLSRKPTEKELADSAPMLAEQMDARTRAGRRLLGPAQLARVRVQPLRDIPRWQPGPSVAERPSIQPG